MMIDDIVTSKEIIYEEAIEIIESAYFSFSGNGKEVNGQLIITYQYYDEFTDPIDLKEDWEWDKYYNLGGVPFKFMIQVQETISKTY